MATPLRARVIDAFAGALGERPTALARAPGRVNLIGEHVDYNGLPVLPMALDRGITIAFRPREDGAVRLRNTDPAFPPVGFEASGTIPPEPAGAWGNYCRAAVQALARVHGDLRGLDGLVASDLPAAAGLSSSSALVVATALAVTHGNGIDPDRAELADLLAVGERYVGLQGGGMDQAISLNARAGHALRIAFRPALSFAQVPVPSTWRIVVAWSTVHAAKSAGARDAYNTRVAECREALDQVSGDSPRGPCTDYADLLTRMSVSDALTAGESRLSGALLRRFRHVVTESARVEEAVAAMWREDLAGFGRLLSASHASLRDDYEVSVPELDELVARAEAGGAAGARLTGAGFGGCVIAAADAETGPGVLEALREAYYRPRGISDPEPSILFTATAGDAAQVMPLPAR